MERERLEKESEAKTLLPQLDRETPIPAASTSASVSVSAKTRDLLKRYGLALALAGLALYLRAVLPVPEGTSIYQLPIAAVVLSGWYGGRGPGLVASLVCAIGVLYRFIPPVDSFELPSDYTLSFFLFIALTLLLCEFSATRRKVERALRASEQRFR